MKGHNEDAAPLRFDGRPCGRGAIRAVDAATLTGGAARPLLDLLHGSFWHPNEDRSCPQEVKYQQVRKLRDYAYAM